MNTKFNLFPQCSGCQTVYMEQENSDKCCICLHCGEPITEGENRFRNPALYHKKCEVERQIAHNQRVMDSAEKLELWDGWVIWEQRNQREQFFSCVDDLVDFLSTKEEFYDADGKFLAEKWPKYAHICTEEEFPGASLEDVLENIMDQRGIDDDDPDNLEGVDDLEEAIDKFNKANVSNVTYYPDYKRAVRLPLPPKETA